MAQQATMMATARWVTTIKEDGNGKTGDEVDDDGDADNCGEGQQRGRWRQQNDVNRDSATGNEVDNDGDSAKGDDNNNDNDDNGDHDGDSNSDSNGAMGSGSMGYDDWIRQRWRRRWRRTKMRMRSMAAGEDDDD